MSKKRCGFVERLPSSLLLFSLAKSALTAYSRCTAGRQHFTMDSVFEWQPNKFLQDHRSQAFALLVLNQPLKNGSNLRKLWRNSSLRIAADGGANRLHELSSFQGKFVSAMHHHITS